MGERPVVGSARGSVGVTGGTARTGPPPLPARDELPAARQHSPPSGAGSNNSKSSRMRGAGAGAAMAGSAGARTDGPTDVPGWPQASAPRAAAGFLAPPRPFREPRPRGERRRAEGKRTRLPASGPGTRPVSAPLGTGSRTQATTRVAFDSLGGPLCAPALGSRDGSSRGSAS